MSIVSFQLYRALLTQQVTHGPDLDGDVIPLFVIVSPSTFSICIMEPFSPLTHTDTTWPVGVTT